jgi:alanine dehydrogenase
VIEVEKEDYLAREFSYPVYVQLKSADLYKHKNDGSYSRTHFHLHPGEYECDFSGFTTTTDILMNGIYWDKQAPRLFEKEDIAKKDFRIQTIADITDDMDGSIPINLGDQSIDDPVYGVDKITAKKTAPYLPGSIDIMAVGNLPNELPRDASRYFGEQLIKYILPDLLGGESLTIAKATIVKQGVITEAYNYLQDYADGK